ncbi:MAG: DUF1343 domain-containing protein [Lentisphaerae bacterium]|nr:DUF1343 domain-containing protein [Lentisphaerota bacterium]
MRFLPGIDVLLSKHRHWLKGRRLGLLSHLAAVDARGMTSAERLWHERAFKLKALFGPEHGFFGLGGAGENLGHCRHPAWRIPVYSLYGPTRRPTPAMFKNLDVIVVDLQDLGARCYTYVATLRYVLEQANALGKEVIVADRPIPLPRIVDGPMRDNALSTIGGSAFGGESFVASVCAPMHYGMTPGEMALWLKVELGLKIPVRVARMQGYNRPGGRGQDWPPWIPPSPGIRAWEAGQCYLATIFAEALSAFDNGRGTNLAFQVFAAPWLKSASVCERLNALRVPGVSFYAHPYSPGRSPATAGAKPGKSGKAATVFDGVRLAVTDPNIFCPVFTSVVILWSLQELYGVRKVWKGQGSRENFFDQLYGTAALRRALQSGATPEQIRHAWLKPLRVFARSRAERVLYPNG